MQALSLAQINVDEWHRHLCRDPCATFLQTFYAAQFEASAIPGIIPRFLYHGEQRILGLQTPWFAVGIMTWHLPPAFLRLAARLGSFLICRGAPQGNADECLAVWRDLVSWSQEQGIFRLQAMTPFMDASPLRPPLPLPCQAIRRATVRLDIEGCSPQRLWQKIAKNARQGVRRAEHQGIDLLEAASDEHIDAYYRIRCESDHRQGVFSAPRAYFHTLRRCFPADICRIWLTRHRGEWVSGQQLGIFNGNIVLCGVCDSNYARANNLYGNDLMQWRIIEWAAAQGMRSIDWGGYFLEPQSEHEIGINRYKRKWGGQVMYGWEYSQVIRPRLNFIFASLRQIGRRLCAKAQRSRK